MTQLDQDGLRAADELLPCPFCGGPGTLSNENPDWWSVGCWSTDCDPVPGTHPHGTRELAIAAWNRRATTSSQGQWRPIETAPRDGTDILVTGRKFGVTGNGSFDAGPYIEVCEWWQGQWTITLMNGYREPTAWMPLPAPPPCDGEAGAAERSEANPSIRQDPKP